MSYDATMRVWRGDGAGGGLQDFTVEVNEGEVVPDVTVTHKDQIPMRPDLLEAFEIAELEKYYTDEELADHPGRRG